MTVQASEAASEAASASFVTAGSDDAEDGDSGAPASSLGALTLADAGGGAPADAAPDLALEGEDRPLLARGACRVACDAQGGAADNMLGCMMRREQPRPPARQARR